MLLELIYRGFEKCQPKFGSIENSSFRVWDGYEFQNRFFATHTHFCPGFFCLLICTTQYKNKMGFVIRKSTKNDSKEILKLIQVITKFFNTKSQFGLKVVFLIFLKELADYEKMPNGPKLTEKDLEEHGYNGPRPFFECLVAFEPSKPDVLIGFVLFFYTYSTWDGPSVFMEDLYVTPASRGQGLGTKLWQGVVQVFFP